MTSLTRVLYRTGGLELSDRKSSTVTSLTRVLYRTGCLQLSEKEQHSDITH